MPLLPHVDYFYDLTTGYNAYVLLNGSPDLVRKVIRFLEDHQIRSTGTGPSRYPARSGAQYDWFIRVETSGGEKPEPGIIHPLLNSFDSDEHQKFRNEVKRLQSQTAELEGLLGTLKQSQAEAASHLAKREEELARMREKNQLLAKKQASTKMTLAEWRMRAEQLQTENALLEEQSERLKQEISDANNFVDEFSTEFDRQRDQFAVLQAEYDSACAERDQVKSRLSDLSEGQPSETDCASLSGIEFMKETLCSLLPSVTFLKDSVEIIAARLENPQPVIKTIRQIVFEGARGKNIQRARGWREIHFNTGLDDSGRIYFRPTQGNQHQILVSFKPRQTQDIEYLQNQ